MNIKHTFAVILRPLFYLMVLAVVSLQQQALAEGDPIRVGITVSLTGKYDVPGKVMLQGVELWVSDINQRGALLGRPVKLV